LRSNVERASHGRQLGELLPAVRPRSESQAEAATAAKP
jgi:hypothetical protein